MGIKKIGIFGGTLNPVHHGHLIVAEHVREKFQLDSVLFIPSGKPPHKMFNEVVSAAHRFNMVKGAVKSNPFFDASSIEIDRTGYTYTVDTLRELAARYANDVELHFIIGADVIPELITWKDFTKVFELCSFIAVLRPGHHREDFFAEIEEMQLRYKLRIQTTDAPLVDISSTAIREKVKIGQSIKYLVPSCVEEYIYNNGLYMEIDGNEY